VLHQLPYIPNLAPSHFHLFGALKDPIHSVNSDWWRDSHSENLAMGVGEDKVPTRHIYICSLLAQTTEMDWDFAEKQGWNQTITLHNA